MLFGGKRFGAALLALGLWLASAPTQADEPSERIVEVRGDIELMPMEGRTNELDAIADDYRASRVRISGGWWALAELYEQLTPFAGFRCGCGEPEISRVTFDHKRKALEAWLERKPRSLTARIALANLLEVARLAIARLRLRQRHTRNRLAGIPRVNGASRGHVSPGPRDRRSNGLLPRNGDGGRVRGRARTLAVDICAGDQDLFDLSRLCSAVL